MKKFLSILVIVVLFSCATTTASKEKETVPSVAQSADTAADASAENVSPAEQEDGAPVYLYSDNDRTKPFTKVGVGTGGVTGELDPSVTNSGNGTLPASKPNVPSGASGQIKPAETKPKKTTQQNQPLQNNPSKQKNTPAAEITQPVKDAQSTKKNSSEVAQSVDETSITQKSASGVISGTEKEAAPKVTDVKIPPTETKPEKTTQQNQLPKAEPPKQENTPTAETAQPAKNTVSSNLKPAADTTNKPETTAGTKTPSGTITQPKPNTAATAKNQKSTPDKTGGMASSGTTPKPKTTPVDKNQKPVNATSGSVNPKPVNTIPSNTDLKPVQTAPIAKADTVKPTPNIPETKTSAVADPNDKNYFGDADLTGSESETLEAGYFSEFPQNAEPTSEAIPVSRSASMSQNQRIRVLYPGEKWVFLGEQTSQKGLNYEQRKFVSGDTEFTFYAKEPGDYILNFSRYDAYSNSFIKDALKVHVGDKISGAQPYVKAPDYVLPTTLAETPAIKPVLERQPNASTAKPKVLKPTADLTVPADTITQIVTNDDLLEKAKKEIAAGDAKNAITDLNQFLRSSTDRLDEAYFYLGQAYELNGSEKNIKEAYKAYKTVTSAFLESDFWQKSDERIRYIKRFFIDIE